MYLSRTITIPFSLINVSICNATKAPTQLTLFQLCKSWVTLSLSFVRDHLFFLVKYSFMSSVPPRRIRSTVPTPLHTVQVSEVLPSHIKQVPNASLPLPRHASQSQIPLPSQNTHSYNSPPLPPPGTVTMGRKKVLDRRPNRPLFCGGAGLTALPLDFLAGFFPSGDFSGVCSARIVNWSVDRRQSMARRLYGLVLLVTHPNKSVLQKFGARKADVRIGVCICTSVISLFVCRGHPLTSTIDLLGDCQCFPMCLRQYHKYGISKAIRLVGSVMGG